MEGAVLNALQRGLPGRSMGRRSLPYCLASCSPPERTIPMPALAWESVPVHVLYDQSV